MDVNTCPITVSVFSFSIRLLVFHQSFPPFHTCTKSTLGNGKFPLPVKSYTDDHVSSGFVHTCQRSVPACIRLVR